MDKISPIPVPAQVIEAEQLSGGSLDNGAAVLLLLLVVVALGLYLAIRGTLGGMFLLARMTRGQARSVLALVKWLAVVILLIVLLGWSMIDGAGEDDGAPPPTVPGAGTTTAPPAPSPLQQLRPDR